MVPGRMRMRMRERSLPCTEQRRVLREVARESGKSDGLFGPAATFFLPARSRKDPGNRVVVAVLGWAGALRSIALVIERKQMFVFF